MSDLAQFITMMTKNVDGDGVYQHIRIAGDEEHTSVSFYQDDHTIPADQELYAQNKVVFMFDATDGSFKGVIGGVE